MLKAMRRLSTDEGGQGLTEYALILSAVVFVIYVALNWTTIAAAVGSLIDRIAGTLDSAP